MSDANYADDLRQFGNWGPPAQMRNAPGFPGPPWGWDHGPSCGCGHCGPRECWPPGRPPCPPGAGWDWNWRPPLGAIRGPIIGVTDGSQAKPGEVGEFISGIIDYTNVPMPAGTATGADASASAVVTPIIVPPGDWDFCVLFRAGYGLNTFEAQLTPYQTPQVSLGGFITAVPEDTMRFFDWTFAGARLQVNTATPLAMVYTVTLGMVGGISEDQSGVAGSGGWFTTVTNIRRMR